MILSCFSFETPTYSKASLVPQSGHIKVSLSSLESAGASEYICPHLGHLLFSISTILSVNGYPVKMGYLTIARDELHSTNWAAFHIATEVVVITDLCSTIVASQIIRECVSFLTVLSSWVQFSVAFQMGVSTTIGFQHSLVTELTSSSTFNNKFFS